MEHMLFILVSLMILLGWGPSQTADAAEIMDPLGGPPSRGFVSMRPADNWEEALISGNGSIGALVMSQPASSCHSSPNYLS